MLPGCLITCNFNTPRRQIELLLLFSRTPCLIPYYLTTFIP